MGNFQREVLTAVDKRFESADKRLENAIALLNRGSPPQRERGRSSSKPRSADAVKDNNLKSIKKLSYAESLTLSSVPSTAIRNIEIVSDDLSRINAVNSSLHSDNIVRGTNIVSINKKSVTFTTVKCANNDEADKLQEKLKLKYGDNLVISKVKPNYPKIKIIGIESLSDSELVVQLKEQNHFLRNHEIVIERQFFITTAKGGYHNAIFHCNIDIFKQIIERGSLILGFSEKKVYEYVDVTICF